MQTENKSYKTSGKNSLDTGKTPSDILASKLSITKVITDAGVVLTKSGSNGLEARGLCPSHEDKSPSLYVNESEGVYHCKGCGIGGRVLDFHAMMTGLKYGPAARELFKKYNIQSDASKGWSAAQVDPAVHLMRSMAENFSLKLQKSTNALAYVEKRGLDKDTIEKFGIGYSFGNEFTSSANFNVSAEMTRNAERAGLVKINDDGSAFHFMKGRLVFPLKDKSGTVIGFSGRRLNDEAKTPKYMNPPETEWFKKSEVMYGLYESKAGIQERKEVVVVEGYMDVVSLHMYGVDNVVSAMGTAVSESAFEQLWSMTNRIVFCLDGDKAGAGGTIKSIVKAAPEMKDGSEILVVALPNSLDPDEYVSKYGADSFDDLCKNGMHLSKYFSNHVEQSGKFNLDSAEGRAGFIKEVGEFASKFKKAPLIAEQILAESKAIALSHMIGLVMESRNPDAPIDEIEKALELVKKRIGGIRPK